MDFASMIALVAAAVGAFLGSTSAFLLEVWRRSRVEKNARHGALMLAQFGLSMQLRSLVNIRDQYLDPVRDHEARFMSLVPFYGEFADCSVDVGSIGFVAVDDEIEVLQDVHMAQDAYLTALSVLRARSEMMAAMYDAAVPRGDFDFESGAETVGVDARKARMLKAVTDGLFESVDSAIALEHEAVMRLAAAGRRILPGREFARVEEIGQEPPS